MNLILPSATAFGPQMLSCYTSRSRRRHTCASWFLLLLVATLSHRALADVAATRWEIEEDPSSHTITITRYRGYESALSIPRTLNGLPVVALGEDAFEGSTNLTSVTIPDSVTTIGFGAFANCSGLTNIILPGSVVSIDSEAFWFCTSLTSLSIPGSITNLSSGLFGYCSSLTNIVIPNSVTTLGYSVLEHCTSLANITLPNSVTSLGESVFQSCTSLTHVSLPNSIKEIPPWTFYGCTSLKSLTIPSTITSIGYRAFNNCTSLNTISLHAGVTSIGQQAFGSCTNLAAITVDPLNPAYVSVEGVLFDRNQTTLIQYPPARVGTCPLPATVTNNCAGALMACSGLNAINVDPLNPAYSSVDGVLFDKSQAALLIFPGNKAGSYTVPGTVRFFREV